MRFRNVMLGVFFLPAALVLAEPPSNGNLLSGPKVEEDAGKQTGERMTKSGQREGIRREQIQPMQWFGMVRELNLSPEQQTKIRAIVNEFGSAQQQFNASRSDEEKAAFRKMREARAAGQEPPKQLRELMQKAESQRPKVEPYQQRIWAELTQEQQSEFKAKLDAHRERMMQQRQDRRGEARPKSPGGTTEGEMMTSPDGSTPVGEPTTKTPQRKRQTGNEAAGGKTPDPSATRGATAPVRPFKKNAPKQPQNGEQRRKNRKNKNDERQPGE